MGEGMNLLIWSATLYVLTTGAALAKLVEVIDMTGALWQVVGLVVVLVIVYVIIKCAAAMPIPDPGEEREREEFVRELKALTAEERARYLADRDAA
jgi:hypothetical protein